MTSGDHFRAGVGILVVNADGLVLVGQRTSMPGAWQAPQGGLAAGEVPLEAAYRELQEETGVKASDVEFAAEYPTWLGYELPAEARSEKTGRGQVQKWFLFRFVGRTQDVDLDFCSSAAEFDRLAWWPMMELVERAWYVRRPVYEQIANHWSVYLVAPLGNPETNVEHG